MNLLLKLSISHAGFGIICLGVAHAEVLPNPLFSDHAVLQQGAEVPVWGTARVGESVTVEFQDQKVTTLATDGKWMVRLRNLKPGGPFAMSIRGDNTIALKNLLVGEVWLCSGQSNMEWALSKSDGGAQAIASAANPLLRMCRVPHNVQMTPQSVVKVKWEEVSPATAKNFSAIPFWFGNRLQKELGVPVGIINNSFGGTTIESWLSAETLKSGPWPQDKNTDILIAKADYDLRIEAIRPIQEKHDVDKAVALAAKLPPPPRPAELFSEFKGPTTLWNGEMVPLFPYRIRGLAWYQGESNAYVGRANSYKKLLPRLIQDLRSGFEQPDLPFLIFQIARNRKWQTDPNEKSGIAELQEMQLKTTLETAHASLIVTTDMGGPDVHYPGKRPVADRAVKAALALAYGRDVSHSGPSVRSVEFKNGKAFIRFAHAEGGLQAVGGELAGFVIAGSDRKFVFADAKIEDDTVVLGNPQVPNPVAARYGWADLPKVNLFNKEGFPASPFRTDNWPLY
jgi:sialate O-acetylesterase